MHKFKFADIGEGLHEGVVAEIYKKEGDDVKEGDSLFSVETDKVTSDIPSPATGKIVKVLMQKGDTIHVGQEIYYIDDGSGDTDEPEAPAAETKSEVVEEGGASVVGEVKVSNELFDLSALQKPATVSATPAPTPTPTPTKKQDTGKAYTGKVDEEFDVIVIGSGPGGYLAAEEAGHAGLKTLIVEKEYWGGVCLNVGCIPTKALLKTSEIANYVRHAADYGVIVDNSKVAIDWTKMHERKNHVVKQLTTGIEMLMRQAKVKMAFGVAKFVGAHEVQVDDKVFRGKNIIIATGSTDRVVDLPGFSEGYAAGKLLTSKEAINLAKKPKSMTIIGGGVIGVEFAQVFASAGVKVTILQNLKTILAALEPDVITEIEKKLKAQEIEIITETEVTKFDQDTIFYKKDGQEHKIKSDVVLVSVGRVPESLGLEAVGIKVGNRHEVLVDEFCQTNIAGVYAIGDVVGQKMLAHVAYKHAVVAVNHITGKGMKYSDKVVPACIYTEPEIAVVGLTETEAKAQNKNYVAVKYQFKFVGKAIAANATDGFAKFIIDKEFGEILGCHIVGAHATDLISEVIVAMDLETTIYDIASAIHPHPTFSEVLWEAARMGVNKLSK
ncbi:dihydrolipoyl dehydrogenase [Candidatus Mycoplasma pogonae]